MAERLTLMAVHAHPDDEVFSTGGVFAKANAEGKRTVLVCCTGGEVGEIRLPGGETPETRENLAAIREAELRRACEILGIQELHFLGYRDSGMAGTPENENPASFLRADPEEAAGRLVRLIREIRPHVVVTYDERGSYGHPDHITAHHVTCAAVEASGDVNRFSDIGPAWDVPKLYYTGIPRSGFLELQRRLRESGLPGLGNEEEDSDFIDFLTPDEEITTRVDVAPYIEQKRKALFVHQSQVSPDEFWGTMPEEIFTDVFRTESFSRARSLVPTPTLETDLFDGIGD